MRLTEQLKQSDRASVKAAGASHYEGRVTIWKNNSEDHF